MPEPGIPAFRGEHNAEILDEYQIPADQIKDLSTGESRGFIEDGDAVILRGYCEKLGFARIVFGESRGEVLSARKLPG